MKRIFSRELPAEFKAGFPTTAKTPWRWDPETGERSVFPYGKSKQNLELRLEPAESLLLVFEPGDAPAPQVEIPTEEQPQALAGPWRVDCAHVDGRRRGIRVEELQDLGIPYETLLRNGINHPDDRGHAFFADELMRVLE